MNTTPLLLNYRNPIDVTLTEEDREQADSFISNKNCIMATALHRMGYAHVLVGGINVGMVSYDCKNVSYLILARESSKLMWHSRLTHPYYTEEVVGMCFRLEPVI